MKKFFYMAGSRADFSPLANTLAKLEKEPQIALEVLFVDFSQDMSCWHNDVNEGFSTVYELSVPCAGKSRDELASVSSVIVGFLAEHFSSSKPDGVIILGDRYEQHLLASLCYAVGIKIVHIHGGEVSGSIDDKFRDAISSFADHHFVSCQQAQDRIINMGFGDKKNIVITGAPGVENILELSSSSLLKPKLSTNYALFMFHPDVLDIESTKRYLSEVTEVLLDQFDQLMCVLGNYDPGSLLVRDFMSGHTENGNRIKCFEHLAREDFLCLVENSSLFVGNSSSGIIEAASLHTPTLNIGSRQNGRYRNNSTFDWDTNSRVSLLSAVTTAANFEGPWRNIYHKDKTSSVIVNEILNISSLPKP